jgi:hypothetical protein
MLQEFSYRIDSAARGQRPGHHRSHGGDQGMEFRGHAWLLDAPDPRRLDLHASLRDPMAIESGQWRVRLYAQRKAIPVTLVADLSASMGFEGALQRRAVLADFAESLAYSAWRVGDSFGFIGCDEAVLAAPRVPPSRARGLGTPLAAALRTWQPAPGRGRHAGGLVQVPRHLGASRSLVFLVSDFHFDDVLIRQVLDGLAGHHVVPVVLWDALEFGPADGTTSHALLPLRDPETGRQRLVWWRPALRERWQAARATRHEALGHLFRAQRLRPLFITGGFEADAVTRHFQS